MVILSYPWFTNMVPIGTKKGAGPIDPWFVGLEQFLTAAKGMAVLHLDRHNEARAKLGLKLQTADEIRTAVKSNLGMNKVAVLVYVENDEPVYLYNHDGTLYLATGPKET